MARLLSTPFFLAAIWAYTPEKTNLRQLAAAFFIIAAISDFVDGYLARKLGQTTKLGALLDPFADKFLVNMTLIFLAVNPHFDTQVPMWFPPVILARDGFITGGAFLVNKIWGPLTPRPSFLGKVATWVTSIAIAAVLLELSFAWHALMLMLVIAIASLLHYFYYIILEVRSKGTHEQN